MSLYTGPIFILEYGTYSPITAHSSAAATGFPLYNLEDRTHPFRTYRSALDPASNDIYITFDLGATPPKVNGIFIDNTNLATWKIQHCATVDGTYSDWFGVTTSNIDLLVERIKIYLDTSSLGQNERYIRIVAPAQAGILAPENTCAIGGITIGTDDNVIELPGGGNTNIEITSTLPTVITTFSGGALEPTEIGSKFVEIVFPNDPYLRDTQEEALAQILNMGTAPFVFFENAGDLSRAYLVRHTQYKNKLAYTVGKVINVPLSFTEVL